MPLVPALRAATAGELLDTAFGMVRRHFLAYMRLAWLPYFIAAAIAFAARRPSAPAALQGFSFLFGLVVTAVVEVRLALASRDLLEGREFGATLAGPILTRRLTSVVLGYLVKWILVVIGLLILVVPGAYLLTLYFGVPCISAFEDLGFRGARKRIRELASQNLLRVFLTVGLFDLAVALTVLALALVFRDPNRHQVSERVSWSGWVLKLLCAPIRAALIAGVYLDCRIGSEGYDATFALEAIPAATE